MDSLPSSKRKRDGFLELFGKSAERPDAHNTSVAVIALRPKASSDDPHKLAAVDTAAVVSEPPKPKIATNDLWAEAYERCKLREKVLVDRYEQHMKAYASSAGTAADDRFSPREIVEVVKARRVDLDAKELTFSLRGESIAIREQGEKIVKFVLWFNSTISSALASQPYASLAWSGVSIILPVSDNPTEKTEGRTSHQYIYF